MKMLHCKRARQRIKKFSCSPKHDTEPEQSSSTEVSVKLEHPDDDTQTCRVCLKEGVIPIFGSNGGEDYAEPLRMFGGIEFHADDEYPKYLCQSCHDLLEGAILLRKTAQISDERLRRPCEFPVNNDKFSDNDQDNDDHTEDLHIPFEYQDQKVLKDDSYKCKKCNLDFDTFKDYADHRISPEHENMRHMCHICKKSYTSLYYKRHMALHKPEKTYMCDICGKEFIVQGQFTRHRLTHFYDLPYKCSLCPYRGRFSESLKMHMRSHTGEKPYQCSACPSKFVSKSNLNKHMWTHKTDHDFKCEACGRGFYTKRSLELHFKVDHTGIKDHVCNICGKAFGYRKQMMKHQLKVHKREKFRSGRLPLYLQFESKEHQTDQD